MGSSLRGGMGFERASRGGNRKSTDRWIPLWPEAKQLFPLRFDVSRQSPVGRQAATLSLDGAEKQDDEEQEL